MKQLFLLITIYVASMVTHAAFPWMRQQNPKRSADKIAYDAFMSEAKLSKAAFHEYTANVVNTSTREIFSGKATWERLTSQIDPQNTRQDLLMALAQARKTQKFCIGRIDVFTNQTSAVNASSNPKSKALLNCYLLTYRDYVELTGIMISLLDQCIDIHKAFCAFQKLGLNQKLTATEEKDISKVWKGGTFTDRADEVDKAFERIGLLQEKYINKERELKSHLKRWEHLRNE